MTDYRCRIRNYLMDVEEDRIWENETTIRQANDREALNALCESIREVGILQPLYVRRTTGNRFLLISGRRRLAAARMAGIHYVPCIVSEADREDALMISLSENLQRQRLHYFEQGEAFALLLRMTGMTPGSLALKLGVKPSVITGKMRLLALPSSVKEELIRGGFREKYARALLRLPDEGSMRKALQYAKKEGMSTEKFTRYRHRTLREKNEGARIRGFCRDLRIYVNSLHHTVRLMKESGIETVLEKAENDACIVYRITIAK